MSVRVCMEVSLCYSSSDIREKIPRHLKWLNVGSDEGKTALNFPRMYFKNEFFPGDLKHISSMSFVRQNLLLLNPTERYLTEQSLNHPAFQPLRQVERERPAPPASPNPPRSSKRKTHHHGENTVPTRSDFFLFLQHSNINSGFLSSDLHAWQRNSSMQSCMS